MNSQEKIKFLWTSNAIYRYSSLALLALSILNLKTLAPFFITIWGIFTFVQIKNINTSSTIEDLPNGNDNRNYYTTSSLLGAYKELLSIYSDPLTTFKINKEALFYNPFLSLILVSIFPVFCSNFFNLNMGIILTYLLSIVSILIISFILHFVGLILGGKTSYFQDLKGSVLSITPLYFGLMLLSIISFLERFLLPSTSTFIQLFVYIIIIFNSLASFLLIVLMIKEYQELKGAKFILAITLNIFLISSVSFIIGFLIAMSSRT